MKIGIEMPRRFHLE